MARVKKPKAQDYKTLKEVWYKKLVRSGFNDIEQDEYNFKGVAHSSYFIRPQSLESWQSKEEYYRMARNFLNDYSFSSRAEIIIWEYHSEGILVPDILNLLKRVRIKRFNRDDVHKIIRNLRTEMKKMYNLGHR